MGEPDRELLARLMAWYENQLGRTGVTAATLPDIADLETIASTPDVTRWRGYWAPLRV